MTKRYLNKISLVALFCILAVTTYGCINIGCGGHAKFKRTDKLTAPVENGTTIIARTDFGSIDVTGADVTDCNVTARISVQAPTKEEAEEIAEKVKLLLIPEGRTLTIKIEKPHLGSNRCVTASFDITVPTQTNLDCQTSFGSIKFTDITGDVKGRTSFASIKCDNIHGKIDLNTSYGSVKCHNVTSPAITAATSFGGIDITCSDSAPPGIIADISTSYGGIDFEAPPQFAGTIDMATSFGSVTTRLPITIKGQIAKEHISATIGNGPGRINLKTSFGSINLK